MEIPSALCMVLTPYVWGEQEDGNIDWVSPMWLRHKNPERPGRTLASLLYQEVTGLLPDSQLESEAGGCDETQGQEGK